MSVTIKSEREIELIRKSCHIIAKIHQDLGKELKAGMSTLEVDSLAEDMIRSYGCVPNFKNYGGFPGSVCVSINNEVVHGIPSAKRIIQEGDIVSLDMGCIYKGYHSDAARTHAIGEVSEEARLLIERTRQSFFEGIKYAKAGNHLHQISNAIGAYCEKFVQRWRYVHDFHFLPAEAAEPVGAVRLRLSGRHSAADIFPDKSR